MVDIAAEQQGAEQQGAEQGTPQAGMPRPAKGWKCLVCGATEPVKAETAGEQCIGCAKVIFNRQRNAARKARSRKKAANRSAERRRDMEAKRKLRGSLGLCAGTPVQSKYVTPDGKQVLVLGNTPGALALRLSKQTLLAPGQRSKLAAANETGKVVDMLAWLEEQTEANIAAERSLKAYCS